MQQFELHLWNFIKNILCYFTGVRYISEMLVHPWKRYDRLVDIKCSDMKKIIFTENIRVLIIDMDGTLKHYKYGLLKENKKWINKIKKYVKIYIVSNANKRYTSDVANQLKLPYIYSAKKPRGECFFQVCNNAKCKKNEIIMIGDSIKNDYLGASKFGIEKTILLNDLNIIGTKRGKNNFDIFYYYSLEMIIFIIFVFLLNVKFNILFFGGYLIIISLINFFIWKKDISLNNIVRGLVHLMIFIILLFNIFKYLII